MARHVLRIMNSDALPICPSRDAPPQEQERNDATPISRGLDQQSQDVPYDIVGRSSALRRVLDKVKLVAPTDATVLILGETGTGKELIAREVHRLSTRRDHPFVKLNCAAIPSGLLESELFGHEKGSFTGASAQRAGRFEAAHKGTLFLDEIGDIPLELQPKLLRVLQDHEFERLGGSRTIHADVRIVSATLRDLREMADEGQFRMDLYYRLNVFPVHLPPLRERSEDIALLVSHFAAVYARHLNREPHTIEPEVMMTLCQYGWPGNIRELQNFIERAVILSAGKQLNAPIEELSAPPQKGMDLTTLKDVEREHILKVLNELNWVLGGPNGVASRLGLPRTTLISLMRRLGIQRPILRHALTTDSPGCRKHGSAPAIHTVS